MNTYQFFPVSSKTSVPDFVKNLPLAHLHTMNTYQFFSVSSKTSVPDFVKNLFHAHLHEPEPTSVSSKTRVIGLAKNQPVHCVSRTRHLLSVSSKTIVTDFVTKSILAHLAPVYMPLRRREGPLRPRRGWIGAARMCRGSAAARHGTHVRS